MTDEEWIQYLQDRRTHQRAWVHASREVNRLDPNPTADPYVVVTQDRWRPYADALKAEYEARNALHEFDKERGLKAQQPALG